MRYRALDYVIHDGGHIEPGEEIPPVQHDLFGNEVPVDFERLVELGAAEPIEDEKPKRASRAKS